MSPLKQKMACDDKGSSGYSRSPIEDSPLIDLLALAGLEDSLNLERGDIFTGSSSSRSARRWLYEEFAKCSGTGTQKLQEAKEQQNIVGRKKQESRGHSLNLVRNRSVETAKPTGTRSGKALNGVIYYPSPVTYEWSVTGPYVQLELTLTRLNRLFENAKFSGALLELVSPGRLGNKQEWKLTVRIHAASSGAAIKVNETLSSMNFEEESMFPIFCDGWTAIQSEWKSKAPPCHLPLNVYGSPLTKTQENGTPNLTN